MDKKELPIGVFDSGMGGLTAVKELRDILPHEDIVYLGDTARVPYGSKSRETILSYAAEDLAFLKKVGVKFTIAACGTVSSVMARDNIFEDERSCGVIRPSVKTAAEVSKNKKIGVIATPASISSGNYERLLKELSPDIEVYSKPCPMFVPLVENGYVERGCIPAVEIAKEYLLPLKQAGIDTLILGCTHYPLLSGIISDILGDGVRLISSGAEAARHAQRLLGEKGLLSTKSGPGTLKLYCTDSADLFMENATHFIDLGGARAERVSLGE